MSQQTIASRATLCTVERDTTTSSYRAPDGERVPIPALVRWVLGLAVAAAGIALLASFTAARVEAELVSRTESAIEAAGLDPAEFSIDYDFRDGTISGELPDGWTAARFNSAVVVDGAREQHFETRPFLTENPDS